MSSAGSGQNHEKSVAQRLVDNDMQLTVANATLKKVLGALHSSSTARYFGMTNATEEGKAALRSKADELGIKLADLEGEKVELEQLQQGPSLQAAGAAVPAAPAASTPPSASLLAAGTSPCGAPAANSAATPPATKSAEGASSSSHQERMAGRKRARTFNSLVQGKGKAEVGGAASTSDLKTEENKEKTAAAAAATVPSSASVAKPEVIDIDCSEDEGASNDEHGTANGAGDDDEPFVGVLLHTPSLSPDLREKAASHLSSAFSAMVSAPARTRRGAEIKRIQESRVNPLAKCNMTEYWQCAHSLALAAAVQFGGTPHQKKLTEALLKELSTENKEVDEDMFSRLEGRLVSTVCEEDSDDSNDGTRGVLVDPKKLVEVCESETALVEYIFGAVEVGKAGASEQSPQKCIVTDSVTVGSTRERLKGIFRALIVHCEMRDEYRKHECYLETWGVDEFDTEESESCAEKSVEEEAVKEETVKEEAVKEEAVKEEAVKEKAVKEEAVNGEAVKEEAVKEEAVKEEAVKEEAVKEEAVKNKADEKGLEKRSYKKRGKNDILRWNRTFEKHPPGPISSFLAENSPGF